MLLQVTMSFLVDSNKLGIYFSPADVINDDIVNSLANIDFNNYLGDPEIEM